MDNAIIVAVVLVIIGLAAWYVIKAKKSGKKCIGCPDSNCCPSQKNGQCGGNCGCCGNDNR
ncbi:MAG: FeoB-associated Cys-rich membrane protein [Clostridia bacterium]|nr:FeoB-associated Cys-rich membrane protein [Clostridia bacterium]